jgi:DNA (cytosine-5)-methyltransferase 1
MIARLLDLFCGAGGAGMGYHRAGFEVVGVDIEPQKNYPFEFHQGDALEYLADHWQEFDVIHASPPCQEYTKASQQWRLAGKEYPDLVSQTREALKQTGKPYVIENVPGAPLVDPVILNGAMFGMLVHRVRLFECSFQTPFFLLPQLPKPVKMGRPIQAGEIIQPVGHFSNVPYAREQMGIDWMTQGELAQAIPPAYTEFIGKQLMSVLQVQP